MLLLRVARCAKGREGLPAAEENHHAATSPHTKLQGCLLARCAWEIASPRSGHSILWRIPSEQVPASAASSPSSRTARLPLPPRSSLSPPEPFSCSTQTLRMPKVSRKEAQEPLQPAAYAMDVEAGVEGQQGGASTASGAEQLPSKPSFAPLQQGGAGDKVEFRRVRSHCVLLARFCSAVPPPRRTSRPLGLHLCCRAAPAEALRAPQSVRCCGGMRGRCRCRSTE